MEGIKRQSVFQLIVPLEQSFVNYFEELKSVSIYLFSVLQFSHKYTGVNFLLLRAEHNS